MIVRRAITILFKSDNMELKSIMEKFAASGWDLISVPAKQWLDGKADKESLIFAIEQDDVRKPRLRV